MTNVPMSGSPTRQDLIAAPFIEPQLPDKAGPELVVGALIGTLFFVGFLGWATFARLDSAAFGQGQIAVEGHRQTIQHKDGGIVTALNVHEGSHVEAGDILLSLAPAEVEAAERSMEAQVIDLEALHARLQAEQSGQSMIAAPTDFATLTGPDHEEAVRALHMQFREMRARAGALSTQESVMHERATQIARSIEGYKNQIATTETQSRLINDELKGTKSLAAHGYASENRVRSLERDDAGLAGQRADLSANAARSQAQIAETEMQALSLKTDRAESIAKDMRDAEFQLDDLLPKLRELKEQVARLQIRSPVAGQVVGLSVFTVGGVVGPGSKLMDIVPDHAPLVVEARMPPNNADQFYIGQTADVKMTSMNDRQLQPLSGKVTRVSADSFTDDKTGAQYFTIEVTVPESEAAKINSLRGPNGGIRPGLPVMVEIPLRKRTAFQFLVEPLSQAIMRSGHE
jgi:HlyD family secretion protein